MSVLSGNGCSILIQRWQHYIYDQSNGDTENDSYYRELQTMVGMLGNLENVMRNGMFTPLTADVWY